jgi:protein tyrosine phosphatase
LAELNAHASGLINFNDIHKIMKGSQKNIYVINLLHDDLYYYKGRCLRWYGLGFTSQTLGTSFFQGRQWKSAYKSLLRLIYGTPPIHDKSQLQIERNIVHDLGWHYYLPLKDNEEWLFQQYFMPDLIKLFESLPVDAEVYIHCAHGRGRTTTILVMYDIFRNGKNVSLKDIVNRHYCLGREDVFDTAVWEQGTWTKKALVARKELVERFYAYMTAPDGYPHQSWDQWNKEVPTAVEVVSIHR